MLRSIKSVQMRERHIHAVIDASAPSLLVGGQHLTLTDSGTGDFILTLKEPGVRKCLAHVTPLETDAIGWYDYANSGVDHVHIKITDLDTPSAADKDVFVTIIAFDSADET